jgi:hypothetical protein
MLRCARDRSRDGEICTIGGDGAIRRDDRRKRRGKEERRNGRAEGRLTLTSEFIGTRIGYQLGLPCWCQRYSPLLFLLSSLLSFSALFSPPLPLLFITSSSPLRHLFVSSSCPLISHLFFSLLASILIKNIF